MIFLLIQVINQDSFIEVIKSDAADVKDRHQTDSIIIIDELRFHISSNLRTVSDIQEAQSKLTALEDLLDDLGIDG